MKQEGLEQCRNRNPKRKIGTDSVRIKGFRHAWYCGEAHLYCGGKEANGTTDTESMIRKRLFPLASAFVAFLLLLLPAGQL